MKKYPLSAIVSSGHLLFYLSRKLKSTITIIKIFKYKNVVKLEALVTPSACLISSWLPETVTDHIVGFKLLIIAINSKQQRFQYVADLLMFLMRYISIFTKYISLGVFWMTLNVEFFTEIFGKQSKEQIMYVEIVCHYSLYALENNRVIYLDILQKYFFHRERESNPALPTFFPSPSVRTKLFFFE